MIDPNDSAFPKHTETAKAHFPGSDGYTRSLHFYKEGMSLRTYLAVHLPGLSEDASSNFGRSLVGRLLPIQSNELKGDQLIVAQYKWWAEYDAAYRVMKADALIEQLNKPVDGGKESK